MPSAHTAVAVSLTTAIAIKNTIWSDLFAISMAFTIIIIYDAINVRFEAGLHASALNKYI
jgi:acid phosphatase family membrane protein YuiD